MAKYDIVKDYDWCSIPRGAGMRKKAPRVWVKSYKIKSSEALNRLKSYLEVASIKDSKEFYNKLYGDLTSPEDDFNFPFFGDNIRSFTNTYGDTFQNGFGGGGGIGGGLDTIAQTAIGLGAQIATSIGTGAIQAGIDTASHASGSGASAFDSGMAGLGASLGAMKGGDPGSYIETPKMYQYEMNDDALPVSFVLSNTINGDYKKNNELIKHLTKINRPFRKNSIAMEPPRIFQVKLPGHRFIKWASCSSFGVNFLGTRREIDGVITPEGYQINMSFQSLTTEVSNFMEEV